MIPSPLSTLTDAQLMKRVTENDVAAFEEIYRRHGKQALRAAYRIVRQPAAAEELTQEAFLSLWRSAAGYQPDRSSLRSWLLLLVHNRGIDQIRRARNHNTNLDIAELHEEHLEDPERTDARAAPREQSRDINALLRTIPIKQRQIVELAYYGEMTHLEIATNLGLPLGTVKGRLRLAHLKLHRALAPEGNEPALLAG
jgi:RNA polymerase sigma-70 factor, ECF subfamily